MAVEGSGDGASADYLSPFTGSPSMDISKVTLEELVKDDSSNRTSKLFLPFMTTLFHSNSVINSSTALPMLLLPGGDDGGGSGSEIDDFARTLVFGTATTNTTTSSFFDDDQSSLYSSPTTIFAVLVTFSICTIFGNSLVIIAVLREEYLKSPPNYFVASLAAADISVGILLVPFEATYQLLDRRWIFGDLWCDLWHSFDVLLSTASILNLCVISLDRYWAICTPMSYPRRMTSEKACKFIALVWILAILISLPAIFWWRSARTGEILPETCPFTEDIGYLISSSCISFYIPLAVMLFAYFKIYKAAVKQSRSIKQGAKLFSSYDTNGTGDLELRMHRGGCCNNDTSHEPKPSPQHRKSISFLRPDPSELALLNTKCKRSFSVRVPNGRAHGSRAFSDSNFRNPLEESTTADNGEGRQQGRQLGVSGEGVDLTSDINSVVDAAGYLLPPINNNYNHRHYNHHRESTISNGHHFQRNSLRQSFSVVRKLSKFAKEKKAAKTLAIVLGVFIICWLPFFVINIVFALCKSCAEGHLILFEVVTWLGWINSAMNPIIYACWSPDLRRAFARLLGCERCYRARRRRKSQMRLSVIV